ncbi:MAG: tetratricopeptide repeat protein [Steroidobacterales bacterium]
MSSILPCARLILAVGAFTSAAQAAIAAEPPGAPQSFYTVTAEIALARREPRIAALQYAAGAQRDPSLLPRAVQVAAQTLQPSIGLVLAERWIAQDPHSIEARRAAAAAALSLHHIDRAAAHYRALLAATPDGVDAGFATVEKELLESGNLYGARQVADRLVAEFPASPAALRMQGFAALRADDPATAVRAFQAAVAGGVHDDEAGTLKQALRRARVLAGETEAPLAEARAELDHDGSSDRRFDYALLLLAAKRDSLAREQLTLLLDRPETAPEALRLLGLIEFQDGDDQAAGQHFFQLITTGHYLDDGYYYQGLIAERHADLDRALTNYARVQAGENGLAAMLRAASILRTHGEGAESEELLNQLLTEEPQSAPEILASRVELDMRAGDAAGALKRLAAAVAQYPDSTELHYERATLMEERGDVNAALRELAAVLRDRPDDPAAQNALGYTLADHSRQLPRARTLIDRAYAAAPMSAAIRDSLGWVLYRQGHAADALPVLTGAFADDPGGDIGAHLGEVLWQLGQRDQAERIWAQAGAIDLDNRLLKSTRQRLRAHQ